MIRLTILTLAVLFGAMALWGDPGARRAPSDDTAVAEVAAPTETAPVQAAPEVVAAETQTPQRVQRYPGPDLEPSPEFAGQSVAPRSDLVVVDGATVMYVTATRVNFRAGPSTNDAVMGALDGGSAVEQLGPESAGWVNIRDAQGRVGYISGQFLTSDAPG